MVFTAYLIQVSPKAVAHGNGSDHPTLSALRTVVQGRWVRFLNLVKGRDWAVTQQGYLVPNT